MQLLSQRALALIPFLTWVSAQSLQDIKRFCDSSDIKYAACFMTNICIDRNSEVPVATYCDPSSLISHLCVADAVAADSPRPSICENAPNSNALLAMPTSLEMHTLNNEICGNHIMDGCHICNYPMAETDLPNECSVMDVYTDMCKVMPMMRRCDEWKAMCNDNGALAETCYSLDFGSEVPSGSTGSAPATGGSDPVGFKPPVMIMYFHTFEQVAVLFRSFTPQDSGQYAGFFVAIVVFTIAGFFFRHFRSVTFKSRFLAYTPHRPGYLIDLFHIIHALLRGVELYWSVGCSRWDVLMESKASQTLEPANTKAMLAVGENFSIQVRAVQDSGHMKVPGEL